MMLSLGIWENKEKIYVLSGWNLSAAARVIGEYSTSVLSKLDKIPVSA